MNDGTSDRTFPNRMAITQLHSQLRNAYTQRNLHVITAKIIALYRGKQTAAIQRIMTIVADHTKENTEAQSRSFSRLMMLYHPDRLTLVHAELDRLLAANDLEQLRRFAHILPVLELERTLKAAPPAPPSAHDDEGERWAYGPEMYQDDEQVEEEWDDAGEDEGLYGDDNGGSMDAEERSGRTFFAAFKYAVYGSRAVELPARHLEELEALDLSGFDVDDLDGIAHCVSMEVLDLSENRLENVAELAGLPRLREVYLSNNRIGYVDGLEFCTHLRILDISYNRIDDLTPLLSLEELEFLNAVGNDIPAAQLDHFRRRNIMVIV